MMRPLAFAAAAALTVSLAACGDRNDTVEAPPADTMAPVDPMTPAPPADGMAPVAPADGSSPDAPCDPVKMSCARLCAVLCHGLVPTPAAAVPH